MFAVQALSSTHTHNSIMSDSPSTKPAQWVTEVHTQSPSPRPVMLFIPQRGAFPCCWLHIPHIVSIYISGSTVFIERERTTSSIQYAKDEEAQLAATLFVKAMEVKPTEAELKAYPEAIGGDIRVHR